MATEMPFRKVSDTVSALTAGNCRRRRLTGCYRAWERRRWQRERERWESQFERGEDVSEGRHRTDILYTEADGVWIHLQREKRRHHEVKSAIAYRVGDAWPKTVTSWWTRGCMRMETMRCRSGRVRVWNGPGSTHSMR